MRYSQKVFADAKGYTKHRNQNSEDHTANPLKRFWRIPKELMLKDHEY